MSLIHWTVILVTTGRENQVLPLFNRLLFQCSDRQMYQPKMTIGTNAQKRQKGEPGKDADIGN